MEILVETQTVRVFITIIKLEFSMNFHLVNAQYQFAQRNAVISSSYFREIVFRIAVRYFRIA